MHICVYILISFVILYILLCTLKIFILRRGPMGITTVPKRSVSQGSVITAALGFPFQGE